MTAARRTPREITPMAKVVLGVVASGVEVVRRAGVRPGKWRYLDNGTLVEAGEPDVKILLELGRVEIVHGSAARWERLAIPEATDG